MNKNIRVILAIASLALASLACQAIFGKKATNTPPPAETQSSSTKMLVSDDFSSNQWGTGTDADSSTEYDNARLRFIVYTKNWFTWSTLSDETYQDVHIEVTAFNNGTDPTTAVGILCNKQPDNSDFYYLAMTPAGEYAIAKATTGESDLFLTNNDKWATSSLIDKDASSYRVGADCGNGKLTLYVDGKQIDSVTDSTYTDGIVGLFVWSGEDATNTDVAFDDFQMADLP